VNAGEACPIGLPWLMQPPRRTGRRRLLNQLQHATLLLVQHPHQPAQLPHLCTVGAMHRAGLADTLQPLRRSGACAWCRRASCTARSASPALCTAGWPVCGHHTAGRRARGLNSCSRRSPGLPKEHARRGQPAGFPCRACGRAAPTYGDDRSECSPCQRFQVVLRSVVEF